MIAAHRRARGWSQSRLARSAGVGKATLSEIEAGARNPTLETLYAIAAPLGVPLAELLRDDAAPGTGRARTADPTADPVVRVPPSAYGEGMTQDHGISVSGVAVTATLVALYRDPGMTSEVYRVQIVPGAVQISPGHGPGVTELLVVTTGIVRAGPLTSPGRAAAGSALEWLSDGLHSYEALDATPAEATLLIRTPCR